MGEITELHCTYDPNTLGKKPEGRKVKGIIHWVSCHDSIQSEVRCYDRLFICPDPTIYQDSFLKKVNTRSLVVKKNCYVEKSLEEAIPNNCFQFERLGYFSMDKESDKKRLIFNRTVSLKDTWKKITRT